MFESVKQERRGVKTYLTSLLISLGVHAAPLWRFSSLRSSSVSSVRNCSQLYVLNAPGLPQVHEPPVRRRGRFRTTATRQWLPGPAAIPDSIPPPDDAWTHAGLMPGIVEGVSLPGWSAGRNRQGPDVSFGTADRDSASPSSSRGATP